MIQYQEGVSYIVALILVSSSIDGQFCHIKPLPSDPCPKQPCFTLSQFVANISLYLQSDTTTLFFQPGNHYLNSELRIGDVLSLRLETSNRSLNTKIICKHSSFFHLYRIPIVHVSRLHFIGCGRSRAETVGQLLIRDTSFCAQGMRNQGTALELVEITGIIEGSIFQFNVGRNLKNVKVEGSNWRTEKIQTSNVGGAIVVTQSNITIAGSTFKNNSAEVGGAIFCEQESNITIINSIFTQNRGYSDNQQCYGGALYCQGGCRVTIRNSTFNKNMGCSSLNEQGGGGAIAALDGTEVDIRECVFKNSKAEFGGAIIAWKVALRVRESVFCNNRAVSRGGAICTWESTVNVHLSRFNHNTALTVGGALRTYGVTVAISRSEFNDNEAKVSGGAISASNVCVVINSSTFVNNKANIDGGAIGIDRCTLEVSMSEFSKNKAVTGGGVSDSGSSIVNIDQSGFINNQAKRHGGAINVLWSEAVNINMSRFINNEANNSGGAINIENVGGTVNITLSELTNNRAEFVGGAIYVCQIDTKYTLYLTLTKLDNNIAHFDGGAITIRLSMTRVIKVNVCNNIFTNNRAGRNGGAISIVSSLISEPFTVTAMVSGGLFSNNEAISGNGGAIHTQKIAISVNESWFSENKAETGIVYSLQSILVFSDDIALCNNSDSIFLFNSNLTVLGKSNIRVHNNILSPQNSNGTTSRQQGGAFTAVQSNIIIHGTCILVDNRAEHGGAIHATESKILVYGEVMIANNRAMGSGGGVHLYQSELKCKEDSNLKILNNNASDKGGGIYAISSLILLELKEYTGPLVLLNANNAKLGGGICLEVGAKIYILKLEYSSTFLQGWNQRTFSFSSNSADYGGAVYITDDTNSATCASTSYKIYSTLTECFIQVLALRDELHTSLILNNVIFTDNYAQRSGSTLFGGLLDRCTVSPYAEVYNKYDLNFQQRPDVIDGVTYIKTVSTINDSATISSQPVQICFCRDNEPDCSLQQTLITVKKGEVFPLSLVAIDQVNHTVNATIRSSLSSIRGGLGEDQSSQNITDSCSILKFSVFSPHMSETLILYAEGPCKDAKLSQRQVDIQFLPCTCPVGFQPNKGEVTKCICECDEALREIITECYERNRTLVREGTFWITSLNTTDNSSANSYLIYPHCPLDYCHPPTTRAHIDLNKENGSDDQCNFNRSGTLCGRCQPGFSLSLGTSHCVLCTKHWSVVCVVILTATSLAGILLVAILLMLNLTVATGTINGIIFYANIINANSSTFFPFTEPNFITVFVSWLNLEFGIDVCLFEGMDMYWKTILQLAFPVYVIFLVILVIFVSEHSMMFARLIGKKNPVAALATLVLLSYTKIIHTIIAGLSFSILDYPNGSREVVWLPDGTVGYLSGKHIILFLSSIGILIAGVTYTALLFSWQWLIYYKHKKIFKCARYNSLYLFLEPYHAPYTFKHRYWTGLLLVVRVVLYLASALNVSRAPGVDLLVTGTVVILLFLLKAQLGIISCIYRNLLVDILETVCYVNIIFFSVASLYVLETNGDQKVLAYISGAITLALFLTVLLYHICFELCSLKLMKLWDKLKQQSQERDDGTSLMDCQCADSDLRERLIPTVTWIDAPSREEQPLVLSTQVETQA